MKTKAILSAAALALLSAGCAGYRVGSTLPDNIKTINVPTFRNLTTDPDLDRDATRQTIREIQSDGTLSIVTDTKGDITLDCDLIRARLSPISYRTDNTRAAKEYRLTLTAKIRVTENATGNVLVAQNVEGYATFEAPADLSSAQRAAIPEASRDLAKAITNQIVEMW